MGHKISNNLKELIKEACPELVNFCDNTKIIVTAINKILTPYVEALQKIIESPEFIQFIEGLQLALVLYKAEEKYWVIDDYKLLEILKPLKEEDYSNTITNYYVKDNYRNISTLINEWGNNTNISDRMPIINSCYRAMTTTNDKPVINTVVIPALLAQITGLTEDLHELVPTSDRKQLEKELSTKGHSPSKGEITTEYLWRQERKREVFDCYTVIFEAVMKNTQKVKNFSKEDLEKYNKYRNKILHGDKQFLNYGTDENLIRCWLELNTLIKVYSIYKNYKAKEFDNE